MGDVDDVRTGGGRDVRTGEDGGCVGRGVTLIWEAVPRLGRRIKGGVDGDSWCALGEGGTGRGRVGRGSYDRL